MSSRLYRNWRRRWTIDLTQRTAAHECGFIVQFTEGEARVIAGQDGVHPEDAVKLLQHARQAYAEASHP